MDTDSYKFWGNHIYRDRSESDVNVDENKSPDQPPFPNPVWSWCLDFEEVPALQKPSSTVGGMKPQMNSQRRRNKYENKVTSVENQLSSTNCWRLFTKGKSGGINDKTQQQHLNRFVHVIDVHHPEHILLH